MLIIKMAFSLWKYSIIYKDDVDDNHGDNCNDTNDDYHDNHGRIYASEDECGVVLVAITVMPV